MSDKPNGTMMERHLQTTIQIIIVAVLLWFGNEVTDNGKHLVKLSTTLDVYASQIVDHEKRIRTIEVGRNRGGK